MLWRWTRQRSSIPYQNITDELRERWKVLCHGLRSVLSDIFIVPLRFMSPGFSISRFMNIGESRRYSYLGWCPLLVQISVVTQAIWWLKERFVTLSVTKTVHTYKTGQEHRKRSLNQLA